MYILALSLAHSRKVQRPGRGYIYTAESGSTKHTLHCPRKVATMNFGFLSLFLSAARHFHASQAFAAASEIGFMPIDDALHALEMDSVWEVYNLLRNFLREKFYEEEGLFDLR